jgi:hypothetical protein
MPPNYPRESCTGDAGFEVTIESGGRQTTLLFAEGRWIVGERR